MSIGIDIMRKQHLFASIVAIVFRNITKMRVRTCKLGAIREKKYSDSFITKYSMTKYLKQRRLYIRCVQLCGCESH